MWENMKTIFGEFYIPQISAIDVIEIAIIVFALYGIIKSIKNTRTMILIKAIFVLFLVYIAAELLKFNVITLMFQSIAILAVFAAIIIFQPELRKFLERLGTTDYNPLTNLSLKKTKRDATRYSDKTISEICDAAFSLSSTKTGALIVIQKDIPLNEYIETGIALNADVSSALFINIFEKNTPLHDGAVIMVKDKIIAGTCYLPLSDNPNISKKLGTRHRAAIGMTETVDCFVVVVSEETGKVSYVENGKLHVCKNKEELQQKLKSNQVKETVINKKVKWNNNGKLKIASLFTGIITWLVIMNSLNPIVTVTIEDVPIDIINDSVISDVGKTYEITSEKTVDVVVTDVRSVVESLDVEDIKVVADMSKLSYVFSVPLSASVNNDTTTVVFKSDNTLTVELDNIVSKEFSLTFNKIGEAQKNYYVSKITSYSEGIIITGAERIINTIDRVEFDVDVTGANENFSKKVTPVIFDKNGNKLDLNEFTLNKDYIIVNAELLSTKTIPLNITLSVDEKANYDLSINDYEPKSIRVAATDDVLEELTGLDIVISTDVSSIDITNPIFTKEININDYLPENVYCADSNPKINIWINYKPFETKTISFTEKDIVIEGLNDKYVVKIEQAILQLEMTGPSAFIQTVSISDLQPYINVEGLKAGAYSLQVQYKNLNRCTLNTSLTVKIEISEKTS